MLCAIPMEIWKRELDGVLYMALHLASKGIPTFFGERMVNEYLFRLDKGKPCIYIDQDQSAGLNQEIADNGGVVFNMNNEGLGTGPAWTDSMTAVHETVSRYFVWGEDAKQRIQEALPGESKHKVKVTGHPSFDLASPKFIPYYRQLEIEEAHGDDYILVNTNFATCNLKMSLEKYHQMLGKMQEWKSYNTPEVKERIWKRRDFQTKLLEYFVDMTKALAARYPDKHVILRPHPMEGLAIYQEAFRDYGNIYVDNSRPVREWIATASMIVHHDCTTGVEAFLMGKPVLRYMPIVSGIEIEHVQGQIGNSATTLTELFELIDGKAGASELLQGQKELLKQFLANTEQNATVLLAEEFDKVKDSRKTWIPKPPGLWEDFKCWRKYLSKLIRSKQPGHNGRKVSYALGKFPRLPVADVQKRVDRLRQVEPDLPEVKLKQLTLNTFLITPVSH